MANSTATFPVSTTATDTRIGRVELERELERLHPLSFGWAMTCCRWQRQEAEEVLQSAYLKALDGRARFGGKASCKTWFFGVIRLTAMERRRRRQLRLLSRLRDHLTRQAEATEPSPEETRERDEAGQRVRAALEQLSDRQRNVLHLVFYQEMTIAEAAKVLGLRLGTARKYYERGKARLRDLLAE